MDSQASQPGSQPDPSKLGPLDKSWEYQDDTTERAISNGLNRVFAKWEQAQRDKLVAQGSPEAQAQEQLFPPEQGENPAP